MLTLCLKHPRGAIETKDVRIRADGKQKGPITRPFSGLFGRPFRPITPGDEVVTTKFQESHLSIEGDMWARGNMG